MNKTIYSQCLNKYDNAFFLDNLFHRYIIFDNLYFVGPLVTMMGKMVKNMIYFVVLLLIVLMSFGVARQAILNPNNYDPKWSIVRDVRIHFLFNIHL